MGKIQYFGAGIQFDVWSRGRAHVQVDHQLRAIKMKKKIQGLENFELYLPICTIHIGCIIIGFYVYTFITVNYVLTFNKINECNPIQYED